MLSLLTELVQSPIISASHLPAPDGPLRVDRVVLDAPTQITGTFSRLYYKYAVGTIFVNIGDVGEVVFKSDWAQFIFLSNATQFQYRVLQKVGLDINFRII